VTYDARETGVYTGAPLEAYLFSMGTQEFCYTPNDAEFTLAGKTYQPESIGGGDLDLSGEDEQGSLEITVPKDNPLVAMFVPDLPIRPLMLTVYAGHQNEAEWRVRWTGEIASCEVKGAVATLTGLPISRVMRRMIPSNTFSGPCNWEWGTGGCGLDRETYRELATVVLAEGLTVTAALFGTHDDGYYAGGWLESAEGEVHWITHHAAGVVTLMTPFRSLRNGQVLSAFPGCQHTIAACKTFGNLQHYLGCPWTPTKNCFVVGL
jgi:hypothetical protein